MLDRSDITSPSRQDKNSGNSGDLVKHSVYIALIRTLLQREPWSRCLHVVEAHAGKGIYVSTSSHLRDFRAAPAYSKSLLGDAQLAAFRSAPDGIGSIGNLEAKEHAYAGSAVLHAMELKSIPEGALTLIDSDPGVQAVIRRVFEEPCLASFMPRLTVEQSTTPSEVQILTKLRECRFTQRHVVHFDPFAFVMKEEDSQVRVAYRDLVGECSRRAADELLAAASFFFTWGSNSAAALEDLDGGGYLGGLTGGYQDLITTVGAPCRIVVTWCWTYYFAMLLVVPPCFRDEITQCLGSVLAPLRPFLSRCTLS